jgi:hypothetical protein
MPEPEGVVPAIVGRDLKAVVEAMYDLVGAFEPVLKCPQCGRVLRLVCQQCGHELPRDVDSDISGSEPVRVLKASGPILGSHGQGCWGEVMTKLEPRIIPRQELVAVLRALLEVSWAALGAIDDGQRFVVPTGHRSLRHRSAGRAGAAGA